MGRGVVRWIPDMGKRRCVMCAVRGNVRKDDMLRDGINLQVTCLL